MNRTIVLARSRAGTSHPSTRHRPAGWRHAWLAGETGAVAWRVPGGSSGHARATPGGSWICWRYRRAVSQHRNDPGGRGLGEARLVRDFNDTCSCFAASVRACEGAAGSRPPPVAACQTIVLPPALDGARIDARQSAGRSLSRHRWLGLGGLGPSRSGDLPGGSCVLAFVEDRLEFF